jgi:hypothetical protein
MNLSKQEMPVNQLGTNIDKCFIQKPEMQREQAIKDIGILCLSEAISNITTSMRITLERWN